LDDDIPALAVAKNPVKARGAVKVHDVRYVLAFGLIGVVRAFILIAFAFGPVIVTLRFGAAAGASAVTTRMHF
jgi:hypothetical protein